jgi:hypothetical protein
MRGEKKAVPYECGLSPTTTLQPRGEVRRQGYLLSAHALNNTNTRLLMKAKVNKAIEFSVHHMHTHGKQKDQATINTQNRTLNQQKH